MRKHHATPAPRGPKAGQAHKRWADKRSTRPHKIDAMVRGKEFIEQFLSR